MRAKRGFNELQECVWNTTLGILPFQAEQPVQAIRLSDMVSEQAQHRNWLRDASAWPHPTLAFCHSFWGNPPGPVLGFSPALRSSQGAAQESSCLFSTCPDFSQCVRQLKSAPSPAKPLCRGEEMFEECLSEDSHVWLRQDNPGLYAIHFWLPAFSSKHFSSLSYHTPIHPRIPTPCLSWHGWLLAPSSTGLELGWQFPWGVKLPLQGLMASATPQWIWLMCNPNSPFPPSAV